MIVNITVDEAELLQSAQMFSTDNIVRKKARCSYFGDLKHGRVPTEIIDWIKELSYIEFIGLLASGQIMYRDCSEVNLCEAFELWEKFQ